MTVAARVAAVQLVSSTRVEDNLNAAAALIEEAVGTGAQLVALPEYFCLMGRSDSDKVARASATVAVRSRTSSPRRRAGTASGWSAARCRWTRPSPTA